MYNLLYNNKDIIFLLLGIFLSFLITTFILDKCQFSNNRIISILQKTLFIFILLFIFLYFLYLYIVNIIECMNITNDMSNISNRNITNINNSDIDNNLIIGNSSSFPMTSIDLSSLFESLYNSNNPVESLILSIQFLQIISLVLILLLIVNLFFKYIGNNKFELLIDNLLQPYNTRVKMILQYIINIYSKSSTINIILIIVLLLITTCASIYYMGILINHFEDFIHLYLKYIKK